MDEELRLIALNAGLDTLLKEHPQLIEAAWQRRRIYAARLEPLSMTDEPAQVFKPTSAAPKSE